VEIDSALISGSRTEVLSMVQSYSYYKWGDARLSRKFPSMKNNSKVKGEEVRVYAKSTFLEVGDGGNLDILGLEGLKNVLLNKNLLNKPYIKINSISFDLQTEQWNIKGEYYEKI